MIDRLFRQKTLKRWLVYYVSNVIVAVCFFLSGYEGRSVAILPIVLSVAFSILVVLIVSHLITGEHHPVHRPKSEEPVQEDQAASTRSADELIVSVDVHALTNGFTTGKPPRQPPACKVLAVEKVRANQPRA